MTTIQRNALRGTPKEPKVTLKAPKVSPRTPKVPQRDPPGAQSVPKVSQSLPKAVKNIMFLRLSGDFLNGLLVPRYQLNGEFPR